MKNLIFKFTILCTIFALYDNVFAQSYPPATPPVVKSSSIFVDNDVSASSNQNNGNDLLKKVNVLETNINNFVPMLMKNSSDINKIRDNADSLVIDLKKQLQDLKHSVKVYDLRLLDVMDRLDKLEKSKEQINYVKNPLDVELNKLKGNKDTSLNSGASKEQQGNSEVKTDNADKNKQKGGIEDKNKNKNQNLNINIPEPPKYHDPLARNQIHVPDL